VLNYSLHRTEAEEQLFESELAASNNLKNPFPGLRPFGIDECHLFFGRENQVDEILLKLSRNRFMALLGYSGSGKSSLMHCGVIPILYGGFMTAEGPNWNVVVSRPGESPIDNLAESLIHNSTIQSGDEEDHAIKHKVTAALLKTGSKGLVDIAKHYKAVTGENLLILIDQFEELYRFSEFSTKNKNEAAQFINLLMDAVEQDEVPIYVATTMRSDFIGESAQYTRLIEHINKSSYVIPLMSRQQKRIAIEGPVSVGGGRISERLVNKLLQDIGDNQDQLPIMQHALMRTWEYWIENREQGEEIDIRHYNAIGKISDALSLHADEAYDELTDKGKRISEVLFKALTETGEDNFGIRRRSSIKEIAAIASVSHLEVIEIVEHFRLPGRSLLMPALPIELTSDSVLEISHESLMRIWTRLRIWVEEETDSAKMYSRISEAAEMHQVGRSGLWRPPDLQLALNWQKKQLPTRQWAERYNTAFERANVFLETSKVSYEAEQKSLELKQQRDLKRAKVMAMILGFAAIIAIFMFVWAITRQIEATKQETLAKAAELVAKTAAANAKIAETAAIDAKNDADDARLLAESRADENAKLNNQLKERLKERDEAVAEALRSAEIARRASEEADRERNISVAEKLRADTLRIIAVNKTAEANSLLHLSVAQSMTTKSLQETDNDLRGLLAQQAYQFNKDFNGYEYDKYIYDGLYYAMANFKGPDYNTFIGHKGAVKAVSFTKGDEFYSVSSDGSIGKWDLNNQNAGFITIGASHNYPLRDIAVSSDENWLAVSSDSSAIELYNMASINSAPTLINTHKGFVYQVRFVGDQLISLGSRGDINVYNVKTQRTTLSQNLGNGVRAFDVNKGGTWLVASTVDGQVIQYNLVTKQQNVLYQASDKQPIHDIKISGNELFIAFGGEDMNVYLWSVVNNKVVRTLRGHTSRINAIEFSHNGAFLATASFDNSVQLWNMNNLNELPIVMQDNFDAYAWDVAFSKNDNYLIISTQNDKIKKWPINADDMSSEICKNIKRNMTAGEWERFVGNNIEFRNTCISLLVEETP
jgi:WD40 repeat protein/energy-coupling factor transporter ATP-binding protein EcfA2